MRSENESVMEEKEEGHETTKTWRDTSYRAQSWRRMTVLCGWLDNPSFGFFTHTRLRLCVDLTSGKYCRGRKALESFLDLLEYFTHRVNKQNHTRWWRKYSSDLLFVEWRGFRCRNEIMNAHKNLLISNSSQVFQEHSVLSVSSARRREVKRENQENQCNIFVWDRFISSVSSSQVYVAWSTRFQRTGSGCSLTFTFCRTEERKREKIRSNSCLDFLPSLPLFFQVLAFPVILVSCSPRRALCSLSLSLPRLSFRPFCLGSCLL